jgi:hypothetical protein
MPCVHAARGRGAEHPRLHKDTSSQGAQAARRSEIAHAPVRSSFFPTHISSPAADSGVSERLR